MKLSALVSWSGKTVELEVGPEARVEAVQQTLADLTGIPKADQILMCEGARLDGSKPLDAYGLPGEDQGKVHDLFLYSRTHLRADAPLPPPETLPDCPIDLGGLDSIRQQRHRLDEAGSPLLRLLPDYQRQFREHLLQANARHEASQQRVATCARLVSEQEVQALSIDAATSNVELHYAYICDAFGAFTSRYQQQHAAHAEVLARFEADLAYLAATELHPSLRGAEGSASAAASPTSLLHLVSAQQLREAAASCARGHQHFGAKVAELEGLFGMLKADVEALFMQAPSVDLEALTGQLEAMHQQVDEQASTVAALSSDLSKVQQLVEQASEALGADLAASSHVSDSVHMLETMRETHTAHLLPRVEACHAAVEAFAATCVECKNALTRDVFTQLRTISSQQSKIREMKNKLALFREALARQESAVQELLVVRRVPAAYKQCLAECVRRGAFMERYAHSAGQLAERMGTFREKEVSMRESFRKHVERLIPGHLLERMGLQEQPPHCQVSVSATEGERLLPVTVDDVRRIQLPWGAAYALAPLYSAAPAAAAAGGTGGGAPSAGSSREGSVQPSAAEQQQQQEEAAAAAAAAAEADVTASLLLENAKLRSELASQIALDCVRAMQTAGQAPVAQQPTGAAGASGQASPHLALSAGSPRPPPSPAALGSGAAAGSLPPEAVQRFERALAAKDGLATELQEHLRVARQQAAVYEQRIRHLEDQLAAMAAAADGRTAAAPMLAASGFPPGPASDPASAAADGSAASSAASSAAGSLSHAGSPAQATAASSGSSTATAAPAASVALPVAQQQAAGTAPAGPPAAATAAGGGGGLHSSVDAAGGSTLSGSLHAPDPSLSLGPSSSTLSASPPLRPPQQQLPAAAAGVSPAQQAGGVSEAWVAAGAEEAPVEPASHASRSPSSSSSHEPSPSSVAAPAAAEALPTSSLTADPAAFAASADTSQELQPGGGGEQGANPAAPLGGAEPELAVQPAAAPPLLEPLRPEAPPEADTSFEADAEAEAAAVPPQPPAQLLASEVLDEGSDVEGIEALDDSSDDEATTAAAPASVGGGGSAAGARASFEEEQLGSGGQP